MSVVLGKLWLIHHFVVILLPELRRSAHGCGTVLVPKSKPSPFFTLLHILTVFLIILSCSALIIESHGLGKDS